MQAFYPPEWLGVLLCFVLWFLLQLGAALFCLHLPDVYFARDGWLYKTRRWERDGAVYQRVFRIRRWKGLLPDGGALFRSGYAKKHLRDTSPQNLERYVLESRRAELTHWLAVVPFWVFGLFMPWYVLPFMLAYALAANLPCIIAQRYNRPRVERLLAKQKRSSK